MRDWQEEVDFAVTVCDLDGKIILMNKKSGMAFQKKGGRALVGANALDCHPGPARARLRAMLKRPFTNAYTIEKNGVKKLIYQTPWLKDGKPRGLVELSLELPEKLPHFIRK
ncbi:MAG TPA: diguanylate cyclase [Elusimicrobia bacterium]|nr:diguanylate cyclase [Elusimicrobiota bacterium]